MRSSDVFTSPIIEVGTANCWDDYFHCTAVHLPFKHLELFYTLKTCLVVWTRHCNYWCKHFSCTIMEEHLCLNFRCIPEEGKSQLIHISLDRCRDHLNRLQNTWVYIWVAVCEYDIIISDKFSKYQQCWIIN